MLSTYRNMGVFHNRKSCEMVTAFGHNSADAINSKIGYQSQPIYKKLNIKYPPDLRYMRRC